MLRSLFCAAAGLSVVLSICLAPQTASARRCGGDVPETLLSLYQNSDAIYVATFDKLVEGKVRESEEQSYSVQDLQKHFTISSTLKGPSVKFFVLEDEKYIYKNTVPSTPEVSAVPPESAEVVVTEQLEIEPEEVDEDGEVKLNAGDTLLLFVKNGDEEDGPFLSHYRDGLKKLSMDDISVYEARIKELNSIFAAKKVDARQLLDWVIRCAEHRVTRWEGTYELLQSVRSGEWREEAAKERRERIAKGEPVEEEPVDTGDPDEAESEEAEREEFDTSVFAGLLDVNHKQILANLLLDSHAAQAANGAAEPAAGDYELLELVKRWGDPRLIGFLADKLRSGAYDPHVNASTMSMIAEVLRDEEAGHIAKLYEEHAYEDGAGILPEEAEETTDAEPADDDPAVEGEPSDAEKPAPKKRTYADLRAQLIQEFLARCDKLVAAREVEKYARNEIKTTR